MARAGSAAEQRRLDGRFHVEIAALSQSARLTREEISLQADIGMLLWLPFEEDGRHDELARQHGDILEAIADGDPDRARLAAERHILGAVERLIEHKLREP
jgi:DNA-binding GntR family transcriptional regulator